MKQHQELCKKRTCKISSFEVCDQCKCTCAPPVPMSRHKKWSIAKSVLRFVGCLAPAFGLEYGFAWFAAWFAAAEALGIAEEVGEP